MINFDIAKTWHKIFADQLEFVAVGLISVPPLDRICEIPGYGETPIIAMTGNAFADDKRRCLEAGINEFLTKPFVPAALFATLLRLVDLRDDN